MEAALQGLATIAYEAGRAIRSPYTPSLQPLYQVLSSSSPSSIKAWLDTNRCCIDALAEVVLEPLRFDPASVRILLILCRHDAFQRACYSHSPVFLASSLDAAATPHDLQQQYHELCLRLLSTEGFGDEPLPAQVSPFLNRFVKHFTTEPSNAALRQILELLRGARIRSWPPDCLEGIQATTVRVLREGHDDEGTSLLCLAVLSILANSSQASDECRAHCREFFTDKKANKTLVLGITSSIKSLSAYLDNERTADEAAEHLWLAGLIFSALHEKPMLVLDRSICLFTRKLCEKVQKDGVSYLVRAAGAIAISELLEDKTPQSIIELVQSVMLDSRYFHSSAFSAEMLEKFVSKFSDSFAAHTVQLCLEISQQGDASDRQALHAFHVASLVGPVFHLLPQTPRVRDAVRKAFAQPSVQKQFSEYVYTLDSARKSTQLHSQAAGPTGSGCCPAETVAQLGDTSRILCQLFVLACPDLDMRLSALAMRQIAQTGPQPKCQTFSSRKALPTVLPLSTSSEDAQIVVDSNRWRETLKELLQANAAAQATKLNQYFQAACFDFERRCIEVEKPLREKELIIAEQESTIDDLRSTISRLQRDSQISASQREQALHERSALEKQLHCLEDETGQALNACEHERDMALHEMQLQGSTHQERERELQTQLDSLRIELERKVQQCVSFQSEVQETQKHIAASRAACDSLSEKITVMEEHAIEAKENQLVLQRLSAELREALEAMKVSKNDALESLRSKAAEADQLEAQMSRLDQKLKALADEKSSLEQRLHESRDQASRLQKDVAAQTEKLVITKDQELSDQSIFYDQALDQLRQELQSVNESALTAAEHHQEIVKNLRHELKALRQEKEKRAKELAQAQQLGHQLMGLMQQPADRTIRSPMKSGSDRTVSESLSPMFHDTQVSQVPDSFTSLKASPNKRRAAGRRALSELPPQSPRKTGSHDRRVSWAPQHKKRGSSFQSSLQDDNVFEQSLGE